MENIVNISKKILNICTVLVVDSMCLYLEKIVIAPKKISREVFFFFKDV